MKLLFTLEGLRRRFQTDPDDEPTAGGRPPSGAQHVQRENVAVIGDRQKMEVRIALGVFVRQLRLREGLSMADLAERAQVTEDELRQVEHNPSYTARPRLIFQLSEYFKVPLAQLSQMSGTTHEVSRALYNDAVKYAAHADDMSKLSREEEEVLDRFVALLCERAKD